jgi:hypothetical protein
MLKFVEIKMQVMNSLQLVSKIRSKTDHLNQNISELLNGKLPFNSIDKDVLKKQCLDLYELILKLKTDSELIEEKNIQKSFQQITQEIEVPSSVQTKIEEKKIEPEPILPIEEPKETFIENLIEPVVATQNFQEVIFLADKKMESLDEIISKVEIQETAEILAAEVSFVAEDIEIEEMEIASSENNDLPTVNIDKAIENKRIQYTVMPDREEQKTVPLNATFKEKELTYNEKIAQVNPPVIIPMAENTIEAPIDSIKSAINLNKKISFVNELFKENVVEYAKAIDRMNNANDRNDAYRIYNELKHHYNWDNNHELVHDLERLIKRRFA